MDNYYKKLIITESRTWLGTKFSHQGRRKKSTADNGGVDCLGLLIGVAGTVGIRSKSSGEVITSYDSMSYSKIPNSDNLINELQKHLFLIDKSEINIADILLFNIDGNSQHLAIVSDYDDGKKFGIIHSYAPSKKVVEHQLSNDWLQKITHVFRFAKS